MSQLCAHPAAQASGTGLGQQDCIQQNEQRDVASFFGMPSGVVSTFMFPCVRKTLTHLSKVSERQLHGQGTYTCYVLGAGGCTQGNRFRRSLRVDPIAVFHCF